MRDDSFVVEGFARYRCHVKNAGENYARNHKWIKKKFSIFLSTQTSGRAGKRRPGGDV